MHMRDAHGDRDELMEIVERLRAVTPGVMVQELTIKRNIMGQLGFHVQPDGVVTLVENAGQARQAGLKQYSRLVEICKVCNILKNTEFFYKTNFSVNFDL